MNLERLLAEAIGPIAGKLHTARSRNDQVATDMHLYVRTQCTEMAALIRKLQKTLLDMAQAHGSTVLPGYTHLQRAQPVVLAHHLLAYFWMLERDQSRFGDCSTRANQSPLGAGALAGTTFPIDRHACARELGFDAPYPNSIDAVSDRDFVAEFLFCSSLCMLHLSRGCARKSCYGAAPSLGSSPVRRLQYRQ